MKTIDLDPAAVEDALVVLAGHLPADVVIGRPSVALADGDAVQLLAGDDPAVWWVREDAAERLVCLDDGRCEVTRWRRGAEVSRYIGRPE